MAAPINQFETNVLPETVKKIKEESDDEWATLNVVEEPPEVAPHPVYLQIKLGNEIEWYNCPICKDTSQPLCEKHIFNCRNVWLACKYCTQKCKVVANLNKHVELCHKTPSPTTWFKCGLCDFKTPNKYALKSHHSSKHVDEKTRQKQKLKSRLPPRDEDKMRCEFCKRKFKERESLKLHNYITHGDDITKKLKTREIPVLIGNKICWKRIVVEGGDSRGFKCPHCRFITRDKKVYTLHVLNLHDITEFNEEKKCVNKKRTYVATNLVFVDKEGTPVKKKESTR